MYKFNPNNFGIPKVYIQSFLFSLNILSFFSLTGTQHLHAKVKPPTFKGIVKLSTGVPSSFDTIGFTYRKPFEPAGSGFEIIKTVTDKNGHFYITMPAFNYPSILFINIQTNKKYRFSVSGRDHYYMEPGDDIVIELIKDMKTGLTATRFTGKQASKYTLINKLILLNKEYRKEIPNIRPQVIKNLTKGLQQFNQLIKGYEQKKTELINHADLNADIQKILKYEYADFFSEYHRINYVFYTDVFKDNLNYRSAIADNYKLHQQEFIYTHDPLMDLCPNFLQRLASSLSSQMVISTEANSFPLTVFYDEIKHRFSGRTRAYLMTNLFTRNYGINDQIKRDDIKLDSIINDALHFVSEFPLLKAALSFRLSLAKGKKVFDATFYDTTGKEVRLSSLKGKVVFIDFWAVGCGWCSIFHKEFHKNIYPHLKNNNDFVYLSVSANKGGQWINTIPNGQYTSPEYLNVNLGVSKTVSHPFIKNYNIRSIPFLLLLDKNGNIVSKDVMKHGTDEALKMISSALKEAI